MLFVSLIRIKSWSTKLMLSRDINLKTKCLLNGHSKCSFKIHMLIKRIALRRKEPAHMIHKAMKNTSLIRLLTPKQERLRHRIVRAHSLESNAMNKGTIQSYAIVRIELWRKRMWLSVKHAFLGFIMNAGVIM